MSRRDFVRASYTGPSTRGQSAARLVRYVEQRKQEREPEKALEDGREREPGREQYENEQQEPERYEKATTFGDRDGFKEAATERAEAGRRSSYVHVVVSPERGNEMTDRDFERLVEPWTKDRQGRDCEHFAAVHRDTEHAHLHVAVARDKFQKAEYQALKDQTREKIEVRERFHGEPEKELAHREEERALQLERSWERGQERGQEATREQVQQRERDPVRDREQGQEMER